MYATSSASHICYNQTNGTWADCDRGGNNYLSQDDTAKPFGNGANYTINSQLPFTVSVQFVKNTAGDLANITTTLTQGTKSYKYYKSRNATYLQQYGNQLKQGMILLANNWGSTYSAVSWLDGKTGCSGDCVPSTMSSTFSNISIG